MCIGHSEVSPFQKIRCLHPVKLWFQEISRMESELANLDYEIKIQQESLETKEAEMNMIRDQINQVNVAFMTIHLQ